MNGALRPILALNRRVHRSRLVLLPAVLGALALGSVSLVSAQQAEVRITELQCNQNPEVVTITNQGNGGQDLSGWTLRSDPVGSESFDLSAVGVLAPGVSVFVQSGPQAEGSFVWSQDFVFRDSDATDFARIVNTDGGVVHEVNCQSASPTRTASPTAAPTEAPTAAPIDVVPVGGGPPGTGSRQTAALMIAAGSWLIAATVGAFVVARLRQGAAQPAAVAAMDAVSSSAPAAAPSLGYSRWLYLLLVLALTAVAGLPAVSVRGRRPRHS